MIAKITRIAHGGTETDKINRSPPAQKHGLGYPGPDDTITTPATGIIIMVFFNSFSLTGPPGFSMPLGMECDEMHPRRPLLSDANSICP